MQMMIDLETLSTRADAAIIQIGLVKFDLYGIKDSWQWSLHPEGRIDPDTLDWWRTNGVEMPEGTMMTKAALKEAHSKFDRTDPDQLVWSLPSAFDTVILGEAFLRHGLSIPWKHNKTRDLRTIRMLYPDVPRPKPAHPHVAVYDALAQTEWLLSMMRRHEVSNAKPDQGSGRRDSEPVDRQPSGSDE